MAEEAVGEGTKWSGLVSIELATGEVHRVFSGRDWNVSAVAGDGRIFSEKGFWDVSDPTAATYLGDHPFYVDRPGGWIAPAYADGRFYHRAFDRSAGRTKLVCIDVRARPPRR